MALWEGEVRSQLNPKSMSMLDCEGIFVYDDDIWYHGFKTHWIWDSLQFLFRGGAEQDIDSLANDYLEGLATCKPFCMCVIVSTLICIRTCIVCIFDCICILGGWFHCMLHHLGWQPPWICIDCEGCCILLPPVFPKLHLFPSTVNATS